MRGNCSKVTVGSERWPPLIFFKIQVRMFFLTENYDLEVDGIIPKTFF